MHNATPGPSFTVRAETWPYLRDLCVALACVLAALLLIGLALTGHFSWLALVAVVPLLFATGLGINLWHLPRAFHFDRDTISVTRFSGSESFRSDRLDEIVSLPGESYPRIILKFSDGNRLVIQQHQIRGNIAELQRRFEEHLTPLIVASPWPRTQARLSPQAFGPGSVRPFSQYLEQPSAVAVSSVHDVITWLKGCQAIPDQDLFGESDVWQHPTQFEQTRKGDCEDHALWAWSKLAELQMEVEFVVGAANGEPHAWVTFALDGELQLLEATEKNGTMVHLARQMQENYIPRCGINRHLVSYRYRDE